MGILHNLTFKKKKLSMIFFYEIDPHFRYVNENIQNIYDDKSLNKMRIEPRNDNNINFVSVPLVAVNRE